MKFSDEQETAMQAFMEWYKDDTLHLTKPFYSLIGYAGTGKTTIAQEIAARVRKLAGGKIKYGAFTGKAAQVLRKKGCAGASTIHSMIYTPVTEDDGSVRFILTEASAFRDVSLIIIDECSMVGEDLAKDLLHFGVPILVLGDTAQLPPVEGLGYFTNGEPDFMLTQIHRQAQDNPIIALSMVVRNEFSIPVDDYGEVKVVKRSDLDVNRLIEADQVLCGLNATRMNLNALIREMRGFDADRISVGERLICLKNDKKRGLLNGTLWDVTKVEKVYADSISLRVRSVDNASHVEKIYISKGDLFPDGRWNKFAKDRFTFGYAITVHKSQGSQWDDVVLFNESGAFREERHRWLYTGITRAAKTLTIVEY